MNLSRRLAIGGAVGTTLSALSGVSLAQAAHTPRQKLEAFMKSKAYVEALKRGVSVMKSRKPSEPGSWFFQAAIHGVGQEAIDDALAKDPGVASAVKYWNQRPELDAPLADRVLWNRAHLYYFERHLRAASGEPSLSLPYWNFTDPTQRTFPAVFADREPDSAGNATNPLYDPRREQGLVAQLYALPESIAGPGVAPMENSQFGPELSDGLGNHGPARGRLKQTPLDLIHFAIGGAIGLGDPGPSGGQSETSGLMANVPTAAFDPVFWVLHANIDRLWDNYDCTSDLLSGSSPDVSWVEARPWRFPDVDGLVKSERRRFYLNLGNLPVAYDSDPVGWQPRSQTKLPERPDRAHLALLLHKGITSASLQKEVSTTLSDTDPFVLNLEVPFGRTATGKSGTNFRPSTLELRGLKLTGVPAVGYDIYVNAGSLGLEHNSPSYVGMIPLFGLGRGQVERKRPDQSAIKVEEVVLKFDVSAVPLSASEMLELTIVPFDLLQPIGTTQRLRRRGALFIREIALITSAPNSAP